MGRPRSQLREIFRGFAGDNVYFQPPQNTEIKYPCIVYHINQNDTEFADNSPYRYTKGYQVTVIDTDPDSPISDQVASLPMCLHNRRFTKDELNHDVFNLYF